MSERYKHKLSESEFFFDHMIESQNNRVHFRYYLSAFLSASRSVLQYADAETNLGKNPNARPEAQKWYLDVVKKSPRVSYFKDARDLNIHTSPISPRAHISVMFKEEIGVGESVTVSINGEKQPTIPKEHEVEVVRKEFPPEVSYKYVFDNWPESEDVIQICRKYLDELASIVKEGIAKGFISG